MAFRGWHKQSISLADGRTVEANSPVIISASRLTDMPAFYARWLHERLQAGYLRWTNPYNARQVQYVAFAKTRAIVFWSKNPAPLMPYLATLDALGIHYYFQFTLNDYANEHFEPNVPQLAERIATFKALAKRIGKERVVWRFDPLLLTNTLGVSELIERISRLAEQLHGFTEKLVISFADISAYRKVANNLRRHQITWRDFSHADMRELAKRLAEANQQWGLELATCAETIDLTDLGIKYNRCIDDQLLRRLFADDPLLMNFLGAEQPDLLGSDRRPTLKDRGQRQHCNCIVSKDIGTYSTCPHLCTYCYANAAANTVKRNCGKHEPRADSLLP